MNGVFSYIRELMKRLFFVFFLLLHFLGFTQADIQLNTTLLKSKRLADHLDVPWDLDMDTEGNLWFVQRNGYLIKLNPSDDVSVLDSVYKVPDVFQSWDNSGLHAMALHPKFPLIPFIYVYYTDGEFSGKLVRLNYSINVNKIIDTTNLISGFGGNSSHNGARIVFENDNIMYLCMGDAFSRFDFPQDVNSMNGKVLRMDINGKAMPDNPFGNLVWSFGHRNPQGLVFGKNNLLYSSEHGTGIDDELNLIEKGGNFGWPYVEGFCDTPEEMNFCDSANIVEPLVAWTPTDAPCGLAYFDHPSIPEWNNVLLQTFLKSKRISVLPLSYDGRTVTSEAYILDYEVGRIRDVFVAPNGKIYYCTSNKETNGASVVQPDDDKIFELYNPAFNYDTITNNNIVNGVIFPNPSVNYLIIDLPIEAYVDVLIYDLLGNLKQEHKAYPDNNWSYFVLDRINIEKGVYLIKTVLPSGKTNVEKVVFIDN